MFSLMLLATSMADKLLSRQFLPWIMFSLVLLATSMADKLLSRNFLPTKEHVFIHAACHINGGHTFILK
jgi:hypothetical protein